MIVTPPRLSHHLKVGDHVELLPPLRQGFARLIHIIPSESTPDPHWIRTWYGSNAPKGAFNALKVSRYVFERFIDGNFVIVPGNHWLDELIGTVMYGGLFTGLHQTKGR